jgi:hypothetical protein
MGDGCPSPMSQGEAPLARGVRGLPAPAIRKEMNKSASPKPPYFLNSTATDRPEKMAKSGFLGEICRMCRYDRYSAFSFLAR